MRNQLSPRRIVRALAAAVIVLSLLPSAATAADGFAKKNPPPPAKAAPPAKPPEPKETVAKTKRAFRIAVELCGTKNRCDPASRTADREYASMLTESERTFMTACEACSTAEKCDAERQRIRDGKRSAGSAPCE
jgi:hypothetical protein